MRYLLTLILLGTSPLISFSQSLDFGLMVGMDDVHGNEIATFQKDSLQWLGIEHHSPQYKVGYGIDVDYYYPLFANNAGNFSLGVSGGLQGLFFPTQESSKVSDEHPGVTITTKSGNDIFVNVPMQIGFRYGRNAYTSSYSRFVNGLNLYSNFHFGGYFGYGINFYKIQSGDPFSGSRVLPEVGVEIGYKWIIIKYFQQLKGLQIKRVNNDLTFEEGLQHQLRGFSLSILWGWRDGMKRPR